MPPPSLHLDNEEDTVDKDIFMQDILQAARAPLRDGTGPGVNEGEDVHVDDESVGNDLGDESVCNV